MIQPLANRILVSRDAPAELSPGGIALLPQYINKSQFATVVEIGSGLLLDDGSRAPMSVAVGDRVVVFRGHELTLEGRELIFVNEDDIIAKLGDDPARPTLLGAWVQLVRDANSEMTKGGIVLPAVYLVKHQKSTVLGIGPGKLLKNGVRTPMAARLGDRVLIPMALNLTLEDGVEYAFVVDEGVTAVLDEPQAAAQPG